MESKSDTTKISSNKLAPTTLMYHELATVIADVALKINTDKHDALQIANICSALRRYDFKLRILADMAKRKLEVQQRSDCQFSVDTVIKVASDD